MPGTYLSARTVGRMRATLGLGTAKGKGVLRGAITPQADRARRAMVMEIWACREGLGIAVAAMLPTTMRFSYCLTDWHWRWGVRVVGWGAS